MATVVSKFASAVAVTLADKGDAFSVLSGAGLPWATVGTTNITLNPGQYLLLLTPGVRSIVQYIATPWTPDGQLNLEMQVLDYSVKNSCTSRAPALPH